MFAPSSVGASKSGALRKLRVPVVASMVNRDASMPPDSDQVTVSLAVRVTTSVVFSTIEADAVAPPVMPGATSSASVTVTVMVWTEMLPAASIAWTSTT